MAGPKHHTLNDIYRLVIIGISCVVLVFVTTIGGYFLREQAQQRERAARRENICNSTVNGFAIYIDRAKREFYGDNPTPEEIAEVDRQAASVLEDVRAAIEADCGRAD